MIEHYNAFISYKHADLDNVIAERIQKKLEHFDIPSALKKKLGVKKIERVFRDKDELPITSNLSDTISYALDNSDFLIVICSTNTKKSAWVPREIEYFLKSHSRDRILTVLADGEPYDVIPEILLSEEKIVEDEEGNEVKINVPLEPLSCDYRIGTRKADKEELPRLASAIIGCSYDELMNRRRAYRTRRMILVFSLVISALIALGSYLYISTRMIKESLTMALQSQSRYLAGESETLLKDNQRVKAVQLALAALPGENDEERPLIPEALRALTDSVNAYDTIDDFNPGVMWNFSMTNDVEEIKVSSSEKLLAGRDMADNVNVWDLETKKVIFNTGSIPGGIENMFFIGDNTLVVSGDERMVSYDIASGKVNWQYDNQISDIFDETHLVAGDKYIEFSEGIDGVIRLDAGTGKVVATYTPDFGMGDTFVFYGEFPSPNGDKFLSVGLSLSSEDDGQGFSIVVYDTNTGKGEIIDRYNLQIYNALWLSESKVVLQTITDYDHYDHDSFSKYTRSKCHLTCIDTNTMETLWEDEFFINSDSGEPDLYYNEINKTLVVVAGSIYREYTPDNGKYVINCDVNSEILYAVDRKKNGTFVVANKDGGMCISSSEYDEGQFYWFHVLPEHIESIIIGDEIYLVQEGSNEIIFYSFAAYDNNWQKISDRAFKFSSYNQRQRYMNDDYLALIDTDFNIGVYDLSNNELVLDKCFDEFGFELDFYTSLQLVGIREKTLYVQYNNFDITGIVAIDLETGKSDTIYQTNSFGEGIDKTMLQGDYLIFYADVSSDSSTLALCKIENNKTRTIDINAVPSEEEERSYPRYFKDIELGFYIDANNDEFLVNFDKDKLIQMELPEDWQGTKVIEVSPDGLIFAADNTRIAVIDTKGKLQAVIPCNNGNVTAMTFYTKDGEDVLLTATSTGFLCIYNLSDYSIMGETTIAIRDDAETDTTMSFDTERGYLYILSGSNLSMVEIDSWYEVAVIERSLGHSNTTDRMYTYSDVDLAGEYVYGYFEHYTLEQLVQMGKDYLGDYQMSDEEKSAYGL